MGVLRSSAQPPCRVSNPSHRVSQSGVSVVRAVLGDIHVLTSAVAESASCVGDIRLPSTLSALLYVAVVISPDVRHTLRHTADALLVPLAPAILHPADAVAASVACTLLAVSLDVTLSGAAPHGCPHKCQNAVLVPPTAPLGLILPPGLIPASADADVPKPPAVRSDRDVLGEGTGGMSDEDRPLPGHTQAQPPAPHLRPAVRRLAAQLRQADMSEVERQGVGNADAGVEQGGCGRGGALRDTTNGGAGAAIREGISGRSGEEGAGRAMVERAGGRVFQWQEHVEELLGALSGAQSAAEAHMCLENLVSACQADPAAVETLATCAWGNAFRRFMETPPAAYEDHVICRKVREEARLSGEIVRKVCKVVASVQSGSCTAALPQKDCDRCASSFAQVASCLTMIVSCDATSGSDLILVAMALVSVAVVFWCSRSPQRCLDRSIRRVRE